MGRNRAIITLLAAALAAVLFAVPAGAAKGGNGKTTTTTESTTTTTAAPADVRDPILFVHGWNSNASTWDTMISRFTAAGYQSHELHRWSYNTSQSNKQTAEEIRTIVARILAETGADQVDLIAHSMGSLSSRWYVKFLGGDTEDLIDAWVSLGGPNHGTDTANLCFSTACREMRIGSAFLGELNAGDESPGDVRYATWWSPCDTVINPDSSVAVAGATNTQTACISHSDLHQNATVFGQVAAFVDP
jgi:triacylglycerol lipase